METMIKVIQPDGLEGRLVAPDATDKLWLTVEVAVVPSGGDPAPTRRADAAAIDATRSALEGDTFDAEDALTQADEANAPGLVG